jgi:hypothetical protein
MNVEIGTETPIFLFWEYLFRDFGILSLQCWGSDVLLSCHFFQGLSAVKGTYCTRNAFSEGRIVQNKRSVHIVRASNFNSFGLCEKHPF